MKAPLLFIMIIAVVTPSSNGMPQDRIEHTQTYYRGRISKVAENWVELEKGWQSSDRLKTHSEEANNKSLRLSAIGTGLEKDAKVVARKGSYRLADLKPGDEVLVTTGVSESGLEEWTTEIQIRRRPGGRIPIQPGELFGSEGSWHNVMQAQQDWEERGLPIPSRFLNQDGRCLSTDPPYPPVAPPPRAKPESRPIN